MMVGTKLFTRTGAIEVATLRRCHRPFSVFPEKGIRNGECDQLKSQTNRPALAALCSIRTVSDWLIMAPAPLN